ncbi:MAG: SWIM zinc finger family protein, partial [Nitrososphaera sp.]
MPRRNPDISQPITLTREEKGHNLCFQKGAIVKMDENTYQVKSQSGNGHYVVIQTEFGARCNCPDQVYRHVKCKHIIAVEYSQELRREVETSIKAIISEVQIAGCKYCGSDKIKKYGIRHNAYGDIQKYGCK